MPKLTKDRSKANVSDIVLEEQNTKIAISKLKLNKKLRSCLKLLSKCIYDPVLFGKEIIGSSYYDYQERVLNALVTHNKVAWRAAHGVGKSYVAADAALWWLFTRPESIVVTTASVWRQVEKILWAEIRSKAKKLQLEKIGWDTTVWPFEVLTTQIKIDDKWFATGESSDTPEKMEGFHSQHIFYIVDEAKAVKKEIFDAIEGALTTEDSKELVISTPSLAPEGYFYEIFSKPTPEWARFHTSAFDSPLVNPKWIEAKKKDWGENNPVYISKVKGDFPTTSIDTLIPLTLIEDAINRDIEDGTRVEIGVDVARFGDDETTIYLRRGFKVYLLEVIRKMDTVFISGRVIEHVKANNAQYVKIDGDGLGAGVIDICRTVLGDKVIEIHGGAASSQPDRYANFRAEMYDNVAELFKSNLISIPNVDDLVAQLANIKYKYKPGGQLKIESKEEMKKRGLKSPDHADGLVYCFAPVEVLFSEPSIRRL